MVYTRVMRENRRDRGGVVELTREPGLSADAAHTVQQQQRYRDLDTDTVRCKVLY